MSVYITSYICTEHSLSYIVCTVHNLARGDLGRGDLVGGSPFSDFTRARLGEGGLTSVGLLPRFTAGFNSGSGSSYSIFTAFLLASLGLISPTPARSQHKLIFNIQVQIDEREAR